MVQLSWRSENGSYGSGASEVPNNRIDGIRHKRAGIGNSSPVKAHTGVTHDYLLVFATDVATDVQVDD